MADELTPPPGRFDDDEFDSAEVVDIKTRKKRKGPPTALAGQHNFDLGDHVEIGKFLVSDLQESSLTTFTEGGFYQYKETRGVYEFKSEQSLRCLVQAYSGSPKSDGKRLALKLSDIKSGITCAADRITDLDFFASARRGIAFLSSFVAVTADGITVHEHKEEHRARFAYDFPYLPDSQPVELLRFLRASFVNDADAEQKIQLLQEHAGMSLIGEGCRYQKVVMMTGNEGSNGKSTFQSMIAAAMPPGSTISVSPHDMSDDYSKAQFPGRLLNVVSEVEAKELANTEPWKAMVDGKNLVKGRAIFKDVIFFRPVAGHLYSCNTLPDTTDQSGGFWRRWEVIPFNRTFLPHEQDTNIEEKVAAERPALVSWLLQGAHRALARGKYEAPPSSAEALKAWRKRADQVDAFVEDKCEVLGINAPVHQWEPADRLYKAYRLWAVDQGHRIPLTAARFKERMMMCKLPAKRTGQCVAYPVRLDYDK